MFPKQFAKIILSLLVQIIGKWIVYCQAPNIEWQYCYGGNSADGGRYILQTIDGGFAICGSSYSNDGDVTTNHGLSDYWILKISGSGELEWQKSYGGSNYDYAQSIQQTNDGGYIVAGVSASVDGDITGHHGINKYDYWIIKLSFAGELEWEKSFGGTNDDYARSVKQVSGDGYIITGSTWSNDGDVTADPAYDDVWVVKISDLGTLQWQQLYHKFDDDYAMEIQQTLEGGYITVGGSNMADAGATGTELYIIKLTDTGIKEWEKTYGGIDSESGLDIHQTSDSGYIIGGEATSNGGDVTGHHGEFYDDYWIVKLDSLGNLQWEKCLGGTNQESGAFISQTIDSGYIISGASTSNDGDVTDHHGPTGGFNQDYWIVKLTGDGIIEWKKSLGGIQQDAGGPILQLTDSSFIVAGTTYSNDGDVSGNHGSSDIWVVKLSNCPKSTYYFDEDGDGFGNILGDTLACYMLSGYVTDSTDCNDTNPDIHPLLFDICNSIDDNCNGLTDEDAVFQTYFADIDGDTYGDPLIDSISCSAVIGFVENDLDCNDTDAAINPDALELCNVIDDNCNTIIDEGLTIYTFHSDADGDTYGDPTALIDTCAETVTGYVSNNFDCNDSDASIYPGAEEICNYLDDDCDGVADDNLAYTWQYQDADGDNYGNVAIDTLACLDIPGYITDSTDCNDLNPNIYPGAPEILNGLDDDCDGQSDEGLSNINNQVIQLSIHPIPATDHIIIDYPTITPTTLNIYSSSGAIIYQNPHWTGQAIDISNFPPAMYYLQLLQPEQVGYGCFVKE